MHNSRYPVFILVDFGYMRLNGTWCFQYEESTDDIEVAKLNCNRDSACTGIGYSSLYNDLGYRFYSCMPGTIETTKNPDGYVLKKKGKYMNQEFLLLNADIILAC